MSKSSEMVAIRPARIPTLRRPLLQTTQPLVSKSHKDRVAVARSPPSSPAWASEAYDEVLLRTHYVVSRW